MNEIASIWDKVVPPDETDEPEESPPSNEPKNFIAAIYMDPRWKWQRRALDLLGSLAWSYAFLKVFVFDVDREIITAIAPGAGWLVDLRFFVVLAIFAIAVLALRPKSVLFAVLYIGLFPLVVLLWKLPKRLLRMKSWVSAFAVVNVVTDLLTHFRYVVVGAALALIAALTILASDADALLTIGGLVLGALLLTALARTFWYSLRPNRFIAMQAEGIGKLLDAKAVIDMTTLEEEYTSSEIEQFDPTQQGQFLMKVASSATANRALYFWGYQLEQYRRSSAAFLYNALAYVWLLTQTVASLTLINWAIFKLDEKAFDFENPPNLLVVARYSFSSLIGGETQALAPASDAANVVSLAAMFIGIGLIAGLVLTLFLSFRREQQNEAIEATLTRIDEIGQELERRHQETFGLSVQATIAKLEEVGYLLRGMVTFFASRFPADWRPGDDPPPNP